MVMNNKKLFFLIDIEAMVQGQYSRKDGRYWGC